MGGIVPRTPAGDNDCGLASYHPVMRLLVRLIGCALLLTLGAKAQAADHAPLVVYDLTHTASAGRDPVARRHAWDEQHLVAALQGLANRNSPQLYVLFVGEHGKTDQYWLDKLRGSGLDGGQWLADRPIAKARDVTDLLQRFKSTYRGVVVYDEHVPATAVIASTVAGADDLLPIRFDDSPGSLYHQLVLDLAGPRLTVKVRLINADGSPMFTGNITGSAKCDALLWAVDHYLKTGKCDPTRLAYYPDAYWIDHALDVPSDRTLLCNHDFFISRRAFFFDLNVWEDESPSDDPRQPLGTDLQTLRTILRAAHDRAKGRMIAVGGFTPWDQKYTNHTGGKHEGVATEWRYAAILSSFDAYMDADAPGLNAMANASVFQHFPLNDRYPQKSIPTEAQLHARGFLDAGGKVVPHNYASIYVGDYDSAAWLYQTMPRIWDDPNRGSVPLGWAFDPEIADRFPLGLHYARATASANDTFISGDSGYAYLNPGGLVPPRKWSDLPSGLPAWEALCTQAYRRWDLRVTGFVIDGFSPRMNAQVKSTYARFSPGGVVEQISDTPASLVNGVPFLRMQRDLPEPGKAVAAVEKAFSESKPLQPHFAIFRTVLWTPTQHKQLFDAVTRERPDVVFVEPNTLFLLLKRSMQ